MKDFKELLKKSDTELLLQYECLFLRVAWTDFERGVSARNGHGSPSRYEVSESDAADPERSPFDSTQGCVLNIVEGRSFATLGQNKRPCEKQAKTGPVKTFEFRDSPFRGQSLHEYETIIAYLLRAVRDIPA